MINFIQVTLVSGEKATFPINENFFVMELQDKVILGYQTDAKPNAYEVQDEYKSLVHRLIGTKGVTVKQ